MILTAAEQHLIHMLRAAGRPHPGGDLTVTVRARRGAYAVYINTHDGPSGGLGHGENFDKAWEDVTALRSRAVRAAPTNKPMSGYDPNIVRSPRALLNDPRIARADASAGLKGCSPAPRSSHRRARS
jgi:hypothetical protein